MDADITAILRSDSAPTSKEASILARVGQGAFRSEVLALWENSCAVTGATLALRASHIKPWRECDNFERLDPNNGLPLVATLDSLFDATLISFDIDGRILLAGTLTEREQKCLSIDGEMRLRRKPSTETESYLKEHRLCLET